LSVFGFLGKVRAVSNTYIDSIYNMLCEKKESLGYFLCPLALVLLFPIPSQSQAERERERERESGSFRLVARERSFDHAVLTSGSSSCNLFGLCFRLKYYPFLYFILFFKIYIKFINSIKN
jgi:hypothetical protein